MMKKKKTLGNNILVNFELFIPNTQVMCIDSNFDDEELMYYNNLPIKYREYIIKDVYYKNNKIIGITLYGLPNIINNNYELQFDPSRFSISLFDWIHINLN